MKKFITLLTVFLLSLNTEAQNISNSEAFDIASKFMAKKGITLVNDDKASTRGNVEPYSIFNGVDGRGFAIVVNGAIVGYSTENSADMNNIPPQLKGILESYSKTITRATTRGDYPIWYTPREVEPIAPLITSKWNQSSPYNDMLDGKTGICVTIANGQLLHYLGVKGCKEVNCVEHGIVLPETTFNHDLIKDSYNWKSSEESKKEVAKFIYYLEHVFAGGKTDYQGALGVSVKHWTTRRWEAESFHDRFYENGVRLNEGYIEDLYVFLDSLLGKKLPLKVGVSSKINSEGHFLLLDGRDSIGLYHLNWGWGGYYDGYFAISNDYEGKDYVEMSSDLYHFDFFGTIELRDNTTSVSNVCNTPKDYGVVYNLQGHKVGDTLEGLPKGVYIKDGKKQVVK